MAADISDDLDDWSSTASNNQPTGSTSVSTNLDDNLRAIQAAVKARMGGVLGTKQASSSGASVSFTSIPSWVKKITIQFVGVSTTGSGGVPSVQLGDGGGLEATGYLSACATLTNAGAVGVNNATTGFFIGNQSADAAVFHGTMTLTLEDSSDNTWAASWNVARSDSAVMMVGAGTKALSATLDRFSVLAGGSDTFDAGEINYLYE